MNIPKEVLSESNYTGTRKIVINDKKVKELKQKLKDLQKSINPILEGLQETFNKFDASNRVIKQHQEEIKRISDELAPDKAFYEAEMKKIEPYEKEAQLIKSKLEPYVINLVKDQLGEFEKPLHVSENEETGEIYVEVIDQIEELVLKIRTQKLKEQENAKK